LIEGLEELYVLNKEIWGFQFIGIEIMNGMTS